MSDGMKPIRRVVTGNDEEGRSKVVWDGPAPNVHESSLKGRGHIDLWAWSETPALLNGASDDGNMTYEFPSPQNGGHMRVIQAVKRPDDYDPAKDPDIMPVQEPKMAASRRRWGRGGTNAFCSEMHKTQTVDYGILLTGERLMLLDDCELLLKPGDIVVQVGAWHQWRHVRDDCQMVFDMIPARFVDWPAGLAQGQDVVMRANPGQKLPAGVKPTRRIVTIDKEPGKSSLVCDNPSSDVRTDPARPGFASARIWVTDSAPAKIVSETLHLPHTIEPPALGTVCRVITVPPDDGWKGKVGAAEVQAFFRAMGSPGASTYSPKSPHPYMQKTHTLDLCCVLEGEIVLVLDTQEVHLKAGEVVVQRGTNHAWSNRSGRPAVVAVSSHDGVKG